MAILGKKLIETRRRKTITDTVGRNAQTVIAKNQQEVGRTGDFNGTSRENPRNAKEVKDYASAITKGIVGNTIVDSDRGPCVHFKYLNGRQAILKIFDPEGSDSDINNLKSCTLSDLRSNWNTVGSAITFGFSFLVAIKNGTGEYVKVILRREPGDQHRSDAFVGELMEVAFARSDAVQFADEIDRIEEKLDDVQGSLETVEKQMGEMLGLLSVLSAKK
jgi:hypothetical protein